MEYEIIHYDHVQNINVLVSELEYRGPHSHREIEVIMVLQGQLKVSTEHEELIFSDNEVAVLSSRQVHTLTGVDGPARILVEQFSPDLYQTYFPRITALSLNTMALTRLMPSRQAWELRDWILLLSKEFHEAQQGNSFLCVSISGWIMHDILKWDPWRVQPPGNAHNLRIDRIVNHIHANYMERLLLSDFADNEGITTTYLSHAFKEQIGMSFQDYVSFVRFGHAKLLLEQTSMNLTEICLCCGISDVRYLNKMMLKYTGHPAKDFRQNLREIDSRPTRTGAQERILSREEAVEALKQWNQQQDWSKGSRLRYLSEMDNPDSVPPQITICKYPERLL